MKKLFNIAVASFCATALTLSAVGCSLSAACTALGEPAKAANFTYSESQDEGYIGIVNKANGFAYNLSEAAYSENASSENFSVAPISVFSGLSLAAECASGDTRSELLAALGLSYNELSSNFSKLYRSLDNEFTLLSENNKEITTGMIKPTNSIWIDKSVRYNRSCVDDLAQKYFAYSYSTDFTGDSKAANSAVRDFVKRATKGIIDSDFELSDKTVFALINTLYIKDLWDREGRDLHFTETIYDFKESDGDVERLRLLDGDYHSGRALEKDKYTAFYTSTYHNFKIKFILPKDGYDVSDVFTAETLAEVNDRENYIHKDEENKKVYYTRCLFPEFETSGDCELNDILRNDFNVKKMFASDSCDLSTLTPDRAYCSKVKHVNRLKVNKTGVEGAAVTIVELDGGAAAPGDYEPVYAKFVVDKAFGFIFTDSNDTVIFSGVVNEI